MNALMTTGLEILTTLAAACFAGGALYVSLVEHPARLRAGLTVAVAQFAESYPRGARWQGSLAAVCLLSGLVTFAATGRALWAVGALTMGAVIPWTLLLMLPTNRRLLDATAPASAAAEALLLARWGRLHSVRAALGVVALLIFLARLGG